ncbi:hypothetical protein A4H96_01985 [Acidithiobacillus ferrooxidans]|uniref:Uncharacterized protein n=1 Tax=Acidithiobacillus ferrooxidans TaxID=920 RepID=A0A179BMW2_ACIFR|nr:hypothetical protein A4H96_01985 [Acidithiobacillus ferrooxidans]
MAHGRFDGNGYDMCQFGIGGSTGIEESLFLVVDKSAITSLWFLRLANELDRVDERFHAPFFSGDGE